MDIRVKRVYDLAGPEDGYRVLVDRLWPRGVSKARARIDLWAKDVTPSNELREAWHADPDGRSKQGFEWFTLAYRAELAAAPGASALDELIELAQSHDALTLVYAARDEAINHAVVLREALLERAASL